jgi:hypothetical protein
MRRPFVFGDSAPEEAHGTRVTQHASVGDITGGFHSAVISGRPCLRSSIHGRHDETTMLREELIGSHPLFGDRLNELTIIGTLRDRELFMPGLAACLCTEEEIIRWQSGGSFDDPWPETLRKPE